MSPSPSPDPTVSTPRAAPAQTSGEFEALSELLLGREKQELKRLREQVEAYEVGAEEVSRVLPQAVTLASSRGAPLATALTPAVESALKESVRRDPRPLVNAVFPIIGPAIRKAIAEAFGRLLQSLNQTLDHSMSARALKWRMEALRTGRSFAEVVLARTLVYRVEQVLLIHAHAGLLLLQVRAPDVPSEDPAMVSGMLTAIQDFARDSFHVPAGESLNTLQVGELTVWVETSPLLTLAAVIRGQAPEAFRASLQAALENIHREQAFALETFTGDAAPFELARPHLESCLQSRFSVSHPKPTSTRLLLGLGLAILLLMTWAFFAMREKRRWAGYLERLRAEPGIVLTETGRRAGKFFVTGLRDPLSADPGQFLSEFQIDSNRLVSRWEAYQALAPPLVLKRARQLLQPPAGVETRIQDGILYAEGAAPAAWIEEARRRAAWVPGIQEFDGAGLVDASLTTEAARQQAIEKTVIFFDDGVHLVPGQEKILETLAARLIELQAATARAGQRRGVSVIGHTDKIGPDDYNQRLSRQRADCVVDLLQARGVTVGWLAPAGVGDTEPWLTNTPVPDQSRNRRVTFRVLANDSRPPSPPP
ncbi:MAG TPA: OmpA family protein [Candidatus Paceibacterota bacterium]|nr:OmpA family protein [Candidatus Paceibacterota bacterium]HRZ99474.1 OmpA family protein [Candidatus Paceibacterota bacterium]